MSIATHKQHAESSGGGKVQAPESSLDAQAHDFRADLLTIQQSPPSVWPRGLLLMVCLLVGGLLVWAFVAKLDVIASAQGRLVPISFTKVVQPAEPGVVIDILVKEGQIVQAGEVLLRLDNRLSQADISGLTRDVQIKKLSLNRMQAELNNAPFRAPKSAPSDVGAQIETQYRARRQSYLDSLAQETEALNKAKADLDSATQILDKLQQVVPIYKQSADAHEQMFKENLVAEVIANEKKREYLERLQDMRAQESTTQGLRSAIAASERKLASISSNYRTQLENERIDTLTQINKSDQELDKSVVRGGMLEIRSPTNGVVKDLTITTKGAVVQAGMLLLNIVPLNEPVQAEVLLSNEDVGFVIQGQKAQIKVATYPFQKYGLLEGKVSLISADASDPKQQQQNQTSQLNYRALISLDSQEFKSPSGEKLGLTPGMYVIAEINQGKRTVLEYLLSPVQKISAEAARER